MNELHLNWRTLGERGVFSVAAATGNTLRLENLDKELAIAIGHAFLHKLDGLSARPIFTAFSRERIRNTFKQRLKDRETLVFGEVLPVNRNYALSILHEGNDTYSLRAGVRHDYEDWPDHRDGRLLQEKFIEAIESLEL